MISVILSAEALALLMISVYNKSERQALFACVFSGLVLGSIIV